MTKEAKLTGGKETKIETEEDIEIRKTDDRVKKLRNKENKSTTDMLDKEMPYPQNYLQLRVQLKRR